MSPKIRSGCTITEGIGFFTFVSIFEMDSPSHCHSTVRFQRERRFLHAVGVLCTTRPSRRIKTTWPVLLCKSQAPEYRVCVPSGLCLLQATVSGFPLGVATSQSDWCCDLPPSERKGSLCLCSSKTWKIYSVFLPLSPPSCMDLTSNWKFW